MSDCNCCGCTVVDVLHRYAYPDSRYTVSAIKNLLQTGGSVVDNAGAASPSTVQTTAAWNTAGLFLQNFPDDANRFFRIAGSARGGTSRFDIAASMVSVDAAWSPLIGRSHAYIYNPGFPPTQQEKTAALSLSLLGSVTATVTANLVPRDLPEAFAQPWLINFDPAETRDYAPVAPGLNNEPVRGFQYNAGNALGFVQRAYLWTAYYVERQAAIVECLKPPYDDDPVPAAVRALYDLPEPAGTARVLVDGEIVERALPAHPGTALSDFIERPLPGLESIVVYAENVSLRRLGNDNDQAWSVHATREDVGPPRTEGFQAKLQLSFGGQTRLIVGGPVWSQNSAAAGLSASIRCLSLGDPNDIPQSGFCTAYVDRGTAQPIGPISPGQNQDRVKHTYFRNGAQVFSAINPTPQQVASATQADGSYLVMYEQQPPSAWDGIGPDSRRWNAAFHKTYGSFVRDTRRPMVGFTAPNDIFATTFESPQWRIVSTKPLRIASGDIVCADDERADGVYARPGYGGFPERTPGNYTRSLPAGLTDFSGNTPVTAPTVAWTVHPVPADNHRGATPTLTDVGLQTCEYYRARSQQERVGSVTLSFDRKIDPSGVNVNQFTLTRWNDNGAFGPVAGLQISPIGDGSRQWMVTIPTGLQVERTFWLLQYDPAGDVLTDDIVTVELGSIEQRPAQGQVKTIYVYPDPENPEQLARSYWGRPLGESTGPLAYFDIAEGQPPVDVFGFPYNPEPCVLAARVAWLMNDSAGWPRPIDTSWTTGPHEIGRVVSLSQSVGLGASVLEDAAKKLTTISASASVSVPATLGTYAPRLIRQGYIPSVPTLGGPAPNHSYFGLTTTIDPCPPAAISACSAPSSVQKHASAIRCDQDIAGFKVKFVAYQNLGDKLVNFDFSKAEFANDGDFCVLPLGGTDLSPGTSAAVTLLAKSGSEIQFGAALNSAVLPQNVWMAVEGGRDATITIRPAASRGVNAVIAPSDRAGALAGEWYSVEVSRTKSVPIARNNDSGLIRQLTGGTVEQTGLQACLSAWRGHRTYPALKTTTLGDLVLSISMRATLKAVVNYRDLQIDVDPNSKQFSWPGRTLSGYLPDVDMFVYELLGTAEEYLLEPSPETALLAWQKADQLEEVDTRTVTHQFLADINDLLVLTKEQEERLAAGQGIMVRSSLGQFVFWWIQRA